MREELESRLVDRLIAVEGKKATVYQDSLGLWTIGIGILVDPRIPGAGLREEEMRWLATNRIRLAEEELARAFPWFLLLNEPRRLVLVELLFNMGMGNQKRGLLSFRNTLPAIARADWHTAAKGLRASAWYSQVGEARAEPLVQQLLTGRWHY